MLTFPDRAVALHLVYIVRVLDLPSIDDYVLCLIRVIGDGCHLARRYGRIVPRELCALTVFGPLIHGGRTIFHGYGAVDKADHTFLNIFVFVVI